MKRWLFFAFAKPRWSEFIFSSVFAALLLSGHRSQCADIVIEPSQTFQTSGLSFNPANGGITGAPLVAGIFNVVIRASNIGGTGSNYLVLNIGPEPAPQLGAAMTQNGLQLSFLALVTHHYSVEWNNNLNNCNWTALVGPLTGNGTTNIIIDPTTNLTERFYRLQVFSP
jgi:hypothetical protein